MPSRILGDLPDFRDRGEYRQGYKSSVCLRNKPPRSHEGVMTPDWRNSWEDHMSRFILIGAAAAMLMGAPAFADNAMSGNTMSGNTMSGGSMKAGDAKHCMKNTTGGSMAGGTMSGGSMA